MRSYVIGCDNAAVGLKNTLKKELEDMGLSVEDVGTFSEDDKTAYPLVAKKACDRVIASDYEKRAVLICGTGIGMCISANKCKGIRAAVCHDTFSARRSILSNDGNVICFGARVIGPELSKVILHEWVGLEFVDGPSTSKVQEIICLEAQNFRV